MRVIHKTQIFFLNAIIIYCCNNIARVEGYVLYAGATVVFNVFLDLGAFFSGSGLIDRHLYRLLPICHYNRSQCGIFRVQLCVVHRPESMKLQTLFVPKEESFYYLI